MVQTKNQEPPTPRGNMCLSCKSLFILVSGCTQAGSVTWIVYPNFLSASSWDWVVWPLALHTHWICPPTHPSCLAFIRKWEGPGSDGLIPQSGSCWWSLGLLLPLIHHPHANQIYSPCLSVPYSKWLLGCDILSQMILAHLKSNPMGCVSRLQGIPVMLHVDRNEIFNWYMH